MVKVATADKRPEKARQLRSSKRDRKKEILEEATRLFRTKGFAGTSIQDISDAVGLLKGSLYYYISSKEDLLFEILKGMHSDGEQIIEGIRYGSADPLRELHVFLREAIIFGVTSADRQQIFKRDFGHIPADRRSEIISERDMYLNAIKRLVTEAVEQGRTSADIDVSLSSKLILSSVGASHEWLRPDGQRPLREAADILAGLLTNSIASRS